MRYRSRQYKSKYPYEPALGVKTDLETLLQRFSSHGTVRYEKFAECWRELNMATYCAGRQTKREAREFVEQCFIIATQFWLPPSSFLVRAGALYLLYGLYYFQLVVPKVKIRLTPDQWKHIVEFQQEAREQQHLDLDYVFQKMKLDKAFMFVATPDEVYVRQRTTDDKMIPDSLKEETSMVEEVFSSSTLNQLALVHDQYHKMKQTLTGEDDTSLNIIHSDLIGSVYSTLKSHREKQAQASLKSQAYKNKTLEEMAREEEAAFPSEETISVQKLLKQKAFEFTSPKSKKVKKVASKDVKDEDGRFGELEYDVLADTEKVHPKKSSRQDLFEKDESENAPVDLPQIHEVYPMPDLDSITPKPHRSANVKDDVDGDDSGDPMDESDSVTDKRAEKRGKRKLSEPKEKKTTSKIQKIEEKEMESTKKGMKVEEMEMSEQEFEVDTENSKQRRRKSKHLHDEISESSCNSKPDGQSEKKSVKSTGSKIRPSSREVEDDQEDELDQTQDQNEGPSAQEVLNMKLNKRKKDARLRGKGKNKQKGKK